MIERDMSPRVLQESGWDHSTRDEGLLLASIREHMEVVGSDGAHVGTVDAIEGARVKFTRKDPDEHGIHHYLKGDFVAQVADRVILTIPAEEARANLTTT